MTGQRSVYWEPRFLAALCLAGLLLVSSANLPISPIQARSANSTLAAPTTPTPVTTGAGSWLWQNPLPQGNMLTAVSCPSTSICYAGGAGGVVLKTLDGGVTWTSLSTSTSLPVWDMNCPTISTCFIILPSSPNWSFNVTTDGGATWTIKQGLPRTVLENGNPVMSYLNGISCPSASVCFVAGTEASGYIARTIDGGDTWVTQVDNNLDTFQKIACPDLNTCYAVGSNGLIAGTKNGGATWATQYQPFLGFRYFQYITCATTTTCYASGTYGNQYILVKTSDGGTNWTPLSFGNAGFYANISCPSEIVCYAVDTAYYNGGGALATGRLAKTQDGGATWTLQFSAPEKSLGFISCPDISNCVVVGNYGTLLKVTNGGTNSNFISYGPIYDLNGVSCSTSADCVSVGISGTILTTNDSGSTWVSQTSSTTNRLNSVICLSPTNCIAVGISGTILTGGPSSWISRTSGTNVSLYGVSCLDINNCFAVGKNGTILASSNGGITWNSQNSSTTNDLTSISCITASNNCFAVGGYNTILSNSTGNWGGQTFSYSGTAHLFRAISCPSTNNCFAVADSADYPPYHSEPLFVYTSDGGNTWNYQVVSGPYPLNTIGCSNNTICYAAGTFGYIYQTIDGFQWNYQDGGVFNNLYGVSCLSNSSCTVVGEGGAILTNELVVTKAQDNGDVNNFGSLSYALNKAVAGQVIHFSVNGGIIVSTTSLNVKPGVRLYSNCASPVTLDFQNNAAISLNLSGQNTLQGIKIIHAAGTGIKATGTGNTLRCTKIQR